MYSHLHSLRAMRCLLRHALSVITVAVLLATLPLLQGCDCSAADDATRDGAGYKDISANDSEAELSGVIKDGTSGLLKDGHQYDIIWSDVLGSNTDGPLPDTGGSAGPVVSTLAGTAKSGHKNGAAATALFNFPSGLTVDKNESVYVADQNNNRIRVVFNKQVADVAGSGAVGSKNGAAASAQFFDPMDVAVDSKGTIYVADQLNDLIRIISKGQVSTLAGAGLPGFKDGPAASALFSSPTGIAVDSKGNVYVADQNNDRIRLIASGKVSTLAGSGTGGFKDGPAASAKFADPSGVAVDSKGKVYVADQNNDRVRVIAGGTVSTLAGSGTIGHKDGPAASAQFDTPIDLAVDALGTVYVADQNNHCIRVIAGGSVKTLAGDGYTGYKDGPVAFAQFNFPTGVALGPSGKLYVADQINARIRVITW